MMAGRAPQATVEGLAQVKLVQRRLVSSMEKKLRADGFQRKRGA